MKIGVISDTHAGLISEVPSAILNALATVDLIVHAGDFTEKAVLDGLTAIGQVKAVSGNMDSQELKKALPRTELFAVGKKKIGLVHGSGGPSGIAERIRELFTDADVIIFGHSHVPCNRYIRGALLFNPGQARNSFGLITIDASIKAEILKA
jgi:putative phosphoesterase